MNNLLKIWSFLDGKKSLWSGYILLLVAFLNEVVLGMWHVDTAWIHPTIDTLSWIGMTLGGIGIGHKIQKSQVEVTDESK